MTAEHQSKHPLGFFRTPFTSDTATAQTALCDGQLTTINGHYLYLQSGAIVIKLWTPQLLLLMGVLLMGSAALPANR